MSWIGVLKFWPRGIVVFRKGFELLYCFDIHNCCFILIKKSRFLSDSCLLLRGVRSSRAVKNSCVRAWGGGLMMHLCFMSALGATMATTTNLFLVVFWRTFSDSIDCRRGGELMTENQCENCYVSYQCSRGLQRTLIFFYFESFLFVSDSILS